MTVERISTQLEKVRKQISQLQAKEKDLSEQKQMAEDAETMKIIKKHRISPEQLRLLNRLGEEEIRNMLNRKEEERKGAGAHE